MINPKGKGTVLKTVSNADSLDVWGFEILIIRQFNSKTFFNFHLTSKNIFMIILS